MAVMENNENKVISLRLFTGTSAAGVRQYKTMNIAPVNPEAEPTNSQIWAFVTGIVPLLQYPLEEVVKTYKSTLKNEE